MSDDKLDKILAGIHRIEINDAVQNEKIHNQGEFIDGVNKKVNKHIEGHAKWIATVLGLITLGGVVLTWAQQ